MKAFKKLMLLLALLLVIGLLRAQVQCNYHGLKDTLSKDMLANLRISNFTGVEIHNALDARVYSADGRMVYRYYVPKMINKKWNGEWSTAPGKNQSFGETLAYTDGRLLVDDLNLPAYSGDLRLTLTLRHPLDTQSIVCQTELTLPLSKGIIDFDRMTDEKTRKATGYFKGLKVELPEITGRFTLTSLQDLTLENTSTHTICDDLGLRIAQPGRSWNSYELKLKNICIPPGRHSLSPEQLATAIIEDRYEQRDTLRPLQIQAQLDGAGQSSMKRIETKQHGVLVLPTKTYYNPALNLSVDFTTAIDDSPGVSPPSKFSITEDTTGQILDFTRPERARSPGLRPASPYGETLLSRSSGHVVTYQTLRSDDMTTAQLPVFLSKLIKVPSTFFKTIQREPFEITFPTLPASFPKKRGTPPGLVFAVRYQELVYLFSFSRIGREQEKDFIGDQKLSNGIELNGHRLQFSFANSNSFWPTDAVLIPGTKTKARNKATYDQYLKTFLVYAEEGKGKPHYEINLLPGQGQARLDHLLTLPYTPEQLKAVAFPSIQREVLRDNRFTFKQHTEAGFNAEWGVPEQVYTPDFTLLANSATGADWATTFGIDPNGNLAKWVTPGISRTYSEVDKEITVNGSQLMFYGSMHEDKGTKGFSFAVCRFPTAEVPKEFYRAMTLQLNSREHSILETMMHQNDQYNVYRSPYTRGFLFNTTYPGMSLLVTGGEHLYQFTVIGLNKPEILSWFNTIKVEGKQLMVKPLGNNYMIGLE
ncbi:MAG: hypothetical protein AB8H12_04875 [Lewinella sp.]